MSDLPSLLLFLVAAASQNGALPVSPAQAAPVPAVHAVSTRQALPLDADGDGYVSRKEAEADPEIRRTFRRADANKDGKLDARELAAAQMLSSMERPARKPDHSPGISRVAAG
jgi:hypothetical protein